MFILNKNRIFKVFEDVEFLKINKKIILECWGLKWIKFQVYLKLLCILKKSISFLPKLIR